MKTGNSAKAKLHCQLCFKQFQFQSQLINHRKSGHHLVAQAAYSCHYCRKRFIEKATLATHTRTHTGERPYKCDDCGRAAYTQPQLLRHHQKVNHKGAKRVVAPKKLYKCQFCDQATIARSHLEIHERIHTGQKQYQCRLCDRSFSQVGHVKVHRRSVHDLQKPFKCGQCPKSFAQIIVAKKHQRIHTGEMPYKCRICKDPFRQAANLAKHQRRIHDI